MFIVAYFTARGTPQAGLSATIRIRRVSTGALVITDAAMVDLGDGLYRYDFGGYDPTIAYALRCDGSADLPAEERYVFGANENFREDIQSAILADSTPFDGADIALILSDTDELQQNQGNWQTATGFSTFDPASEEVNIGAVKGLAVASVDDFKASVAALNQFVADVAKLTGNDVTLTGTVITIYADDGTTPWRTYDLVNGGRVRLT